MLIAYFASIKVQVFGAIYVTYMLATTCQSFVRPQVLHTLHMPNILFHPTVTCIMNKHPCIVLRRFGFTLTCLILVWCHPPELSHHPGISGQPAAAAQMSTLKQ